MTNQASAILDHGAGLDVDHGRADDLAPVFFAIVAMVEAR